MKELLLLVFGLLLAANAAGQSGPTAHPRTKGAGRRGEPQLYIGRVRLAEPVLVFYRPPAPGTAVQQLVMDKAHLPLLRTLSLDQLVQRREVFVDGLSNRALPGTDANQFRLVGASLLANAERKPAGDGRSTYTRLKVPGELYVVREPAEEYRHFVLGPQQQGARIDFQTNALPGVDSVRAVYTLRKIDDSERGAGSGAVIR